MNIGSSKSIWGHGGRFDGEEVSSTSSWGEVVGGSLVGGGGVVAKRKISRF